MPLARAVDASAEFGLDKLVEPKGSGSSSQTMSREQSQARRQVKDEIKGEVKGEVKQEVKDELKDELLDGEIQGASDTDVGQTDEKHWKSDLKSCRKTADIHAPTPAEDETHEEDISADALHSRLLTKKQLSEMAWGVRELSRRLGSVRLKFRARSIFLLTKIYDHELIPKTRELAAWLLSPERGVRYVIYVEKELKENKKFGAEGMLQELKKQYGEDSREAEGLNRRLRVWDENMCRNRPHTFDFVITLGGDGTVLYASWLFQRIVPPVLSFALGSLGFLTKFDFDNYKATLGTAFDKGVTVSLRLRFEGTIMRSQKKKMIRGDDESASSSEDEEAIQRKRDLVEELIGEEQDDEHTHYPAGTYEILNEIVIDRGPNPSKLLHFATISFFTNLSSSNVLHRDLWRRRALHHRNGRRCLRLHAYRKHSLQSCGRRLPLPPGESGHACNSHLCAHLVFPTHYRTRHHCAADRGAV